MATAERRDLLRLLTGLSEAHWNAPTLCANWAVRDVVAHIISCEGVGAVGLARKFVQGRFWLSKINAVGVARLVDAPLDVLLEAVDRNLRPAGLTTAFGGRIARHRRVDPPSGHPQVPRLAAHRPPGASPRGAGLRAVRTAAARCLAGPRHQGRCNRPRLGVRCRSRGVRHGRGCAHGDGWAERRCPRSIRSRSAAASDTARLIVLMARLCDSQEGAPRAEPSSARHRGAPTRRLALRHRVRGTTACSTRRSASRPG